MIQHYEFSPVSVEMSAGETRPADQSIQHGGTQGFACPGSGAP